MIKNFTISFILIFCSFGSLNAKKLRVGLVLDKGGIDDKSFNAAAFKGAQDAKKDLGIHIKTVTASDDTAIEPSFRTFARRRFDMIIGIGFVMGEPLQKVAKEFPNKKFLLVDSIANAPNVRSIVFEEHEGSYLVGAIAAMTTKTQKIGFLGGMDIPLIRRFELGYRTGAKSIHPKIKVMAKYVGSTSDAWRNPTRGKELTLSQYRAQADIVFAAAGASALGGFDAAEQLKKLIIGVDSNQNWIKPGYVLTSMLKRVDLAVYRTIKDTVAGKFTAGTQRWGLKDGGIDFAIDQYNRKLISPEIEKKANEIKAKIISKEIVVPDYYKIQKGTS